MSAGLSINQTLYNGGRSFYNVKQAKINLEIAKLRERNIRMGYSKCYKILLWIAAGSTIIRSRRKKSSAIRKQVGLVRNNLI